MAFSKMGRGEGENDPSYQAHKAFYDVVEEEDHDAGLVENVPEYSQEHATKNLSKYWGSQSEVVDPRLFGQGCARPRRYIILWNKKTVQWRNGIHLHDVLNCLRAHPKISARKYFWMLLPSPQALPPGQDFLEHFKHVRVFDVCFAIILIHLYVYECLYIEVSVHVWSKPLFSPMKSRKGGSPAQRSRTGEKHVGLQKGASSKTFPRFESTGPYWSCSG